MQRVAMLQVDGWRNGPREKCEGFKSVLFANESSATYAWARWVTQPSEFAESISIISLHCDL